VYHEGRNLTRLGMPQGAQTVSPWCPVHLPSLVAQTAVVVGVAAVAAGAFARFM
jgi:hypothetical protein